MICWFCGEPDPCGSRKCAEILRQLRRDETQSDLRDRRLAFFAALRDRGETDCSEWWRGLWYGIKAAICVFLRLEGECSHSSIDVGAWDVGPAGGEHGGTSWSYVEVESGVMSGWVYGIGHDTSC